MSRSIARAGFSSRACCLALLVAAVVGAAAHSLAKDKIAETSMLTLHTRSRVAAPVKNDDKKDDKKDAFKVVEKTEQWDPKHTALIICDMWDDHWCQGAARRVEELAGPVNDVVAKLRKQGALIIHAPSSTVDYYKGTPGRQLAQKAPLAKTPKPLSTVERWGTCWCYPDESREGPLPIDDSDMGCDCKDKCEIREAWTRQIAAIEIQPGDAVTDNGQETWNLLAERKIDNVLILGVHLNMCVLGRPFAIRQLVTEGKHVVLIRDLTDTMYNHEKKPFVNHFSGTDLVVEHVEKYWCPTITSNDLGGGKPFKFKEDTR